MTSPALTFAEALLSRGLWQSPEYSIQRALDQNVPLVVRDENDRIAARQLLSVKGVDADKWPTILTVDDVAHGRDGGKGGRMVFDEAAVTAIVMTLKIELNMVGARYATLKSRVLKMAEDLGARI